MDPVRDAIHDHLAATAAVTSQLGAVNNLYHRIAPRNATPPYVVYHQQAGTPRRTFQGPPMKDKLWTVKAISRGSSNQAEDIAAAIIAALDGANVPIAGHELLYLAYESDVDYGELDGADQWHHVGGIFRVDIDPL